MRYYEPVYHGEYIYSCDMLRLLFKTEFRDSEDRFIHIPIDKLLEILILNDYTVEYFTSNRISAYKHMYIIRKKNQVVTIGLEHNHMTDNVYNHFIEFNPNKVDMKMIAFILKYLKRYIKYNKIRGSYFEIGRWDLAVDLPVERSLVHLLKDGKKEYKYVIGSDSSVSEYCGKRNTAGFTKVYDKTRESKLDYDCTRIEVTFEADNIILPTVYLKEFQNSLDFDELTETDFVIVEMIKRLEQNEQYYWFSKLGRKKQEKLKKYVFSEDNLFEFNLGSISKILDTVNDISEGFINEEGGCFIGSFGEWSDKYYKQCFAVGYKSSTLWKEITEEKARTLFL